MKGSAKNNFPLYYAGIALLLLTMFCFTVLFPQGVFLYGNSSSVRELWTMAGDLAAIFALISVVLWGVKRIALLAGGNKSGQLPWLNGNFFSRLRKTHVFCGWLAFALGFGHGAFFLINMPGRLGALYTGLAAILAMLMLLGLGILYQQKLIRVKIARTGHLALAVVFGALLLMHM